MDKLLTKKVEELTLYLIEKDAKEREQNQTIDELKIELKQIKAQLNAVSKLVSNHK
ncbi:hypothetical protein [Mucilaginibacter sp.]